MVPTILLLWLYTGIAPMSFMRAAQMRPITRPNHALKGGLKCSSCSRNSAWILFPAVDASVTSWETQGCMAAGMEVITDTGPKEPT